MDAETAALLVWASRREENKSEVPCHCGPIGLVYLGMREFAGESASMSDSPLALRMLAAKFAQLARSATDAREAERLMAQARRYERLAVEAERSNRQQSSSLAPAEKAKTPSES